MTAKSSPKYFASGNSCPKADMRLDRVSGCDYYCHTCGARHWDPCKQHPCFMYGVFDPAEFT
jgi:hypothetical protein